MSGLGQFGSVSKPYQKPCLGVYVKMWIVMHCLGHHLTSEVALTLCVWWLHIKEQLSCLAL